MATQRRTVLDLKAPPARMALSGALLSGVLLTGALFSTAAAAIVTITGSGQVGWCLGVTSMSSLSMLGHCPWCYSALALIAASAAVWPEPIGVPIKI